MIKYSETLTGSNTSDGYSCERTGALSYQFSGGSWNSGNITVQGSLDGTNWEDFSGGVYTADGQDVIEGWYGFIRFVASSVTSVSVQINTAG